jgi:uncharacterized protein
MEADAMSTTPHEMFQLMLQRWLSQSAGLTGDDLTDDVIVEMPFAPPGRPKRIEGRQPLLDHITPQRAAFPVRFDAGRVLAVHDTTDPDTIVVEYELTGTSLKTNKQSSAAFISILTMHDGKIALWREYQNTHAIMQALA